MNEQEKEEYTKNILATYLPLLQKCQCPCHKGASVIHYERINDKDIIVNHCYCTKEQKEERSDQITACPYCNSTDVDWATDTDHSIISYVNTASCESCGKFWYMIYKFSEWRPIDD